LNKNKVIITTFLLVTLLLNLKLIYTSAVKNEKNLPPGEPWREVYDIIDVLKSKIDVLSKENAELKHMLENHRHNYSDIDIDQDDLRAIFSNYTFYYSDIYDNLTDIRSQLENHTHDYSELTGEIPAHNHNYSDIINQPLILDETDVINLIENYTFGEPDFDSGWQSIEENTELILNHNVNTTDVFVYIIGKNEDLQTHQIFYGGDKLINENFRTLDGIYWYSNENSIYVKRLMTDINWIMIRIVIWKLPAPPI
jgi:hypothetical protein